MKQPEGFNPKPRDIEASLNMSINDHARVDGHMVPEDNMQMEES